MVEGEGDVKGKAKMLDTAFVGLQSPEANMKAWKSFTTPGKNPLPFKDMVRKELLMGNTDGKTESTTGIGKDPMNSFGLSGAKLPQTLYVPPEVITDPSMLKVAEVEVTDKTLDVTTVSEPAGGHDPDDKTTVNPVA